MNYHVCSRRTLQGVVSTDRVFLPSDLSVSSMSATSCCLSCITSDDFPRQLQFGEVNYALTTISLNYLALHLASLHLDFMHDE